MISGRKLNCQEMSKSSHVFSENFERALTPREKEKTKIFVL